MKTNPDFDKIISPYNSTIQLIAALTRMYIMRTLPHLTEEVDLTEGVVRYLHIDAYKRLVCSLIVSDGGVHIGLQTGSKLADPMRIMAGSDYTFRYIAINDVNMLRSSPLKSILLEADTLSKKVKIA